MPDSKADPFIVGLSDAEKHDLEKMINDFRNHAPSSANDGSSAVLQAQVDHLNRKMADLTEMFLTLDRRMAPLVEVMRLSHQKSELLSQRLDAVIAALKKGQRL